MSGGAKYFIVEAEAMPEIIRKVAEAKRLLETGEKTTVNGAAREVGISRSAFYKYKDAVHPFQRYAPRQDRHTSRPYCGMSPACSPAC